jgi:branched-chain amino acid transport system ATP-binding protein
MSAQPQPRRRTAYLSVNNIEVIYDHVILVLKGVSLTVPEGSIVALLGGNGAGKSTTLKSISTLLRGERGEVTKGSIEFRGERVDHLTPNELVKKGHVPGDGRPALLRPPDRRGKPDDRRVHAQGQRAEMRDELERVYHYFPRLKHDATRCRATRRAASSR